VRRRPILLAGEILLDCADSLRFGTLAPFTNADDAGYYSVKNNDWIVQNLSTLV
jgi:hypothetical protein